MNEVAATVDEMDADHDGVIDEHSWEQIRASVHRGIRDIGKGVRA